MYFLAKAGQFPKVMIAGEILTPNLHQRLCRSSLNDVALNTVVFSIEDLECFCGGKKSELEGRNN